MSYIDNIFNQNGNNVDSESSRKVFIHGLTADVTSQQLRDYFSQYGEVNAVDCKIDKFTGQTRGYGFITFADKKVADWLINSGGRHNIGINKIVVKKISKKSSRVDCKIFVGGVSQDTTESDIRSFFTQFGNIVEFEQPFDKMRNLKKNFCFVTFSNPDEVKKALQSPKQIINGKQVDVKNVIFNPETMSNKIDRRQKVTNIVPYYYGYEMTDAATTPACANYVNTTMSYEAYGPAYGGYDYNALGYDPNILGYVAPAAISAATATDATSTDATSTDATSTDATATAGTASAASTATTSPTQEQRLRAKENNKPRYTPY